MSLIAIGSATITAAKFVGSMAAWEVGTRALSWAFGDDDTTEEPEQLEGEGQIEYDANGNYMGIIGAAGSMGAVYGGKKMYNQRNRKNIPFNSKSNKQSNISGSPLSGQSSKVRVNPRVFEKKTPILFHDGSVGAKRKPGIMLSKSRALTLVGGGGSGEKYSRFKRIGTIPSERGFTLGDSYGPTVRERPQKKAPPLPKVSQWDSRRYKDPQGIKLFEAPKISNSKGSKTLFQRAMKLMPKTKKGKVGAAMVLMGAIGKGLGMIGKDEPTNSLGDRLLKNALLNKAYEGEMENALNIDYASKIQKNLGKQLNRLLKDSEISASDAGELVTKMEADLQDAGINMLINSYQMYKLKGGSDRAYLQSSKEYSILKQAKNAISREADTIRGSGTDEEKNEARNSIVKIKKALIGQNDEELQQSIRITNEYFRNAIAMRQSLMGTMRNNSTTTPTVNASLLKEFHTMVTDWDSYSTEEQDALGPMRNYIESLIPQGKNGMGGVTIADILMSK